ncbi:MAG: CRISPR-associated protein Csx14 [Nitrososphaerota archaeon]
MKVSLVTTLGTSPPVVTEFLRYVAEAEKLPVTALVVIATKDEIVLKGLELVRAAVRYRYPSTHIRIVTLPFQDVTSQDETLEFMARFAEVLQEQRSVHRASSILLSLAGGRKDMGITAALVAQYFGVNGVYHIVMPNIKIVNEKLEAARHHIDELNEADDSLAYYGQHADIFEPIMYPPLSEYSVIKIPLIPYPTSLLKEVARLLEPGKKELRRFRISQDVVRGLQASGLVRVTSAGTVYPLEEGLKLYEMLRRFMLA